MKEKNDSENLYFCHSVFNISNQSNEFSHFCSKSNSESNDMFTVPKSLKNKKINPGQIMWELNQKSNYGLRSGKHSRQKHYSVIFSKLTDKKPSRIKKRSMLMQMTEDPENKCSGMCFEEISLMYGKITDLKIELEKYISLFGKIKEQMNILEKISLFTNVVKFLKLEFEPCAVREVFYKTSKNIQEVDQVRACSKRLSTDISSLYTKRKSKMIDVVKNNRDEIKQIFGSVDVLRNNSQYIMSLFDKNALRYLDNNMALYWNTLIDIKEFKVNMIHVDGKYYGSPSGWKQSFEIVAVLEKNDMVKSVSLGFAFLSSSTQENYTLLFKKIKDYKYLRIDNIMLDFEIAIYNAAKTIFPKCVPRGCYYHYRNNVINRATKLKRWLNKSPKLFTINVLSLCPFVSDPTGLLYAAIKSLELEGRALFKSPDFKILMYVYETYVLKLKSLFKINLSASMVRTNNPCEGRNSVLKRHFSFKPQISDLVDFITIRFKKDAVKKLKSPLPSNSYDLFLIAIQKESSNIDLVIEFCKISINISLQHANKLLVLFCEFNSRWDLGKSRSWHQAEQSMEQLKQAYHSFNSKMKQEFEIIKIKCREYKEYEEEKYTDVDTAVSTVFKSNICENDSIVGNDMFEIFNDCSGNTTSIKNAEICLTAIKNIGIKLIQIQESDLSENINLVLTELRDEIDLILMAYYQDRA